MLTIFSIPKPFEGHIGVIQRNAIESWINLKPRPKVILIGNETGINEICEEHDLINVANTKCNEQGTPYLNYAFAEACKNAANETVCYSNTDIIFNDKIIEAMQVVKEWKKEFLIIGGRCNVDINYSMNFNKPDWQEQLHVLAKTHGNYGTPHFIDYFIFPRNVIKEIPPFLVGRPFWDNWFIWNAINQGISVVDASDTILAVHQNHDYAHHADGRKGAYEGSEAAHNSELLGGRMHYYCIDDANYKLNSGKISRNLSVSHHKAKYRLWVWMFLATTRSVRHKLGINGSNVNRILKYFAN